MFGTETTTANPSTNWLVGTGFTSWYRIQGRVDFLRPTVMPIHPLFCLTNM